jgi:hypothetical protein
MNNVSINFHLKYTAKKLILSTLMMEAMRSSEMSVLTRATWRHILEDGTHHNPRLY